MFNKTILIIFIILTLNLLSHVYCLDKCALIECPKLKCSKNEIVEVPKGECCGKCISLCFEMCKDIKCPTGYSKAKILGSCCETCIENRAVNYDNINKEKNNNRTPNKHNENDHTLNDRTTYQNI